MIGSLITEANAILWSMLAIIALFTPLLLLVKSELIILFGCRSAMPFPPIFSNCGNYGIILKLKYLILPQNNDHLILVLDSCG